MISAPDLSLLCGSIMAEQKLTYVSTGVNYDVLDPIKILAQQKGLATIANLAGSGVSEVAGCRGESAYVLDIGDRYLAMIEECLGTKSLIADAMRPHTGRTHFDQIAQDTVAAMVNDLVTVGARPLTVLAYWATGNEAWLSDPERAQDLINGWAAACDLAGATWGGGETPHLSGIVESGAIDLAGACVGLIEPKERCLVGKPLVARDRIVLLGSSGIHANGLSLARKLAERLPEGYATKLPSGRMYGEALLDPSPIYAKYVQAAFENGLDLHYLAHITGHGWRKVMRHREDWTYRIERVPEVPEVLSCIQREAGLSDAEAYGTFNMGAGYAVFVSAGDAARAVALASEFGLTALDAGAVEAGEKQVMIEPLGVRYVAEDLKVRV